jgi:hypothetical protein
MTDPQQHLEAILAGATTAPAFPANSRYHAVPIATLALSDGRTIAYLRRRFVPPPDRLAPLREHTVVQGDRLDVLAATHLGDPELFWRLCDANGAMDPGALTAVVGRRLRVSLPEGLPGGRHGG